MPTLAEQQLPAAAFAAMCEELRALAQRPTLEQVRDIMVRYGVTSPAAKDGKPSLMAAKAVVDGPFARHIARLNAARESREALCAAAGAGKHPLDALEEALVIELQDLFVGGDDGKVDVQYLVNQVTKLRAAISMRTDAARKETDLERRLRESAKKIEATDAALRLRDEQIGKLERERAEWEDKRRQLAEQAAALRDMKPDNDDEMRAKVVDLIDRAVGLTR